MTRQDSKNGRAAVQYMDGSLQFTAEEVLAENGNLLVRRVIGRDDHVGHAFFEVATDGRKEWTYRDWNRFLDSLEKCEQTVREWMDQRKAQQ